MKSSCLNILFMFIIFGMSSSCTQKKEKTERTYLRINFDDGDIPSLHPHQLDGHIRGRALYRLLFEGLTRMNGTTVELSGASSLEVSPCGKIYRFTVRPMKWSNGESVTAHHYENSWKMALSPSSDCTRADLLFIIKNAKAAKKGDISLDDVGIKALNDQVLEVELEIPAPFFLELTTLSVFAPYIDENIFNGPFVVDSWQHSNLLSLRPNPFFWNCDHVKLQGIDISMVGDSNTSYSMFRRQEIDWVGDPFGLIPAEIVNQHKDELKHGLTSRFFWIYLNAQDKLLSSPSIRQALSLCLDRKLITDHLLIGDEPLCSPLPCFLSHAKDTISSEADFTSAKKLFKQGLNEIYPDPSLIPQKISLQIDYCNVPEHKKLAEHLQQLWEDMFGITVNLQGAEWNVYRSQLAKGNFQIGGCVSSPRCQDPMELLERFEHIEACNFSKWSNAAFENKLVAIRQTNNKTERDQLIKEAEYILLEEMPFIPISCKANLFGKHPQLTNYKLDHAGCVDFSYAYFKKE